MDPPTELALSTRFIEAYNRLDEFMRKKLNTTRGVGHSQLLRDMVKREAMLPDYLFDLEGFAHLRNAIVHSPPGSDSRPIAEPHPDVVREYECLVSAVIEPPLASTMAVPLKDIFSTEWSDGVLQVVETMQAKTYTHVPVLANSTIAGVFSESTLFAVLAARRQITINHETKMSELREFVPLYGGVSEVFEFLSVKTSVPEVAMRFQRNFREKRRLGAVFLTQNGGTTDQLCGLITAWDVASLLAG
jgi:predicted transcriptional regulator